MVGMHPWAQLVDVAVVPARMHNAHSRQAERPNQLSVSDFAYVSTWQGWIHVAFVVDVFSRRVVGWRQSSSMHTGFVLGALEQALFDRRPSEEDRLVHHSDRG